VQDCQRARVALCALVVAIVPWSACGRLAYEPAALMTTGSGDGGGTGGNAGAGGASGGCLEALADRAAFVTAVAGRTSGTEDFSVDAQGNPVTSFGYYASDAFAHHGDVTFESFVTSLQAPPGTREPRVFSLAGPGVKSSIGFAPGFDGITAKFSMSEVAVAFSGRVPDGTDGFTISVQTTNSASRTTFTFFPTAGVLFAGVGSRCGAVIQLAELSPNFSATGDGNSQYWELASISYAR
jgi:hypothetical protein